MGMKFSRSVCFLLLATAMLAAPVTASAYVAIGVSVTVAPPPIPVYVQPLCPGPGYIWVPGYWAWDPYFGYYWVPGTWVLAPYPGLLWTPGYWVWSNGFFTWREGYWGPVVGFYGGINYGFGYYGYGYNGGYWRGRVFYYNRAVNNINITRIRTVYYSRATRVVARRTGFNGGPGGIRLRPTSAQLAAARSPRRLAPIVIQRRQERAARADPRLRATANRGRPAIAATRRPGIFTRGIVRARRAGAPYRVEPLRRALRRPPFRPMVRPRMERRPGAFGPPGVRKLAPQQRQMPRTSVPPSRAPRRQFAPPPERRPGTFGPVFRQPGPERRYPAPRRGGEGGRGEGRTR